MSNKKRVFALLVGINEYPNPRHHLEGCIRDIKNVQSYLDVFCQDNNYDFDALVLKDNEATREGIIKGFKHFETAEETDICFFMYSGHGSRCLAPPELKHFEADGYLETVVCYDSRNEGGKDLIDKEISWLIWNVTKNKNGLHFLVIMDCCYSGTLTRTQFGLDDFSLPKEIKGRINYRSIKEFLGFEDYFEENESLFSSPVGRHVLLSAARDNQTAKEVFINKKRHGIFTYCILDTLKKNRGQIPYSNLIRQVNLRIRNFVSNQSPQLESIISKDKDYYFLSTRHKPRARQYLITWDKEHEEWHLNAGTIHGIPANPKLAPTTFLLPEVFEEAEVTKVFANYAVVNLEGNYDTKKVYKSELINLGDSATSIGFAKENEITGVEIIKSEIKIRKGYHFEIVEDSSDALYFINAKEGSLFLTYYPSRDEVENTISPLFPKVNGYNRSSAIQFLNDIETFLQWIKRLEIRNPSTYLREEEIDIHLFRISEKGNLQENAKNEMINWKQQPIDFIYNEDNGTWSEPRFRLKIQNKGFRKIWVSLCYFSSDFSINNHLLGIQELNPDESVWAFTIDNYGYRHTAIPLWIDDKDHKKGTYQIEEYLKIFICTEEFSTDEFNQGGIPSGDSKRGGGWNATVQRPDWMTEEILIRIERPKEATLVEGYI